MKIGVFDSGVGGITVLTALRERFASTKFVYLGDTAHVPYGTRSPAQIKVIASAAVERFKPYQIDALVVACNTASSLALGEIHATIAPVPVFGVVEAGAQATLEAFQKAASPGSCPVLILSTRATAKSGVYSRLLRPALPDGTLIIEQPCPLLVPMIEEGWIDHSILHQTILEYVKSHADSHASGVALLACTHYPWIQAAFERALPGWTIVNSATAVAELLARELPALAVPPEHDGGLEWIFTDPDAVPKFAMAQYEAP